MSLVDFGQQHRQERRVLITSIY